VTSFEFQLHEMQRQVIGGMIAFPIEQARDVLDFFADYSMEAPDELSLDMVMFSSGLTINQMNRMPGSNIGFSVCYSGPHSQAEAILDKIRSAGTPVADNVGAIDYVALQKTGDVNDPRALGTYTKSGLSAELTPAFIDAIVEGYEAKAGRATIFAFQQLGGAIGRVADDATAFAHRNANYVPLLIVDWPSDKDASEHIAWLKGYWATIEPHIQGFYTNDLIDETQEEVNRNYLGNYSRLVALKNKYDPTNLFRLNANIIPAAS
jgi:hypothetical protein